MNLYFLLTKNMSIHVTHLSIRNAQNTLGTQGTLEYTGDLWCQCWEGPNVPSVGEGSRRWERLPPTQTRSRKSKATHYAYCMMRKLYNAQKHLNQRCELGDMVIWVGCYPGTTPWNSKWSESGSRDCWGLNNHNLLNTCRNGANDVSISI